MPIDASRNPYDAPRFDGGGKAVRPDDVASKEELDDDLDGALEDLAATKGAVAADDLAGTDDPAADDPAADDLDLAGTGVKGSVALDDELVGSEVKSAATFGGPEADDVEAGAKGAFDQVDDDLDLAGTGAKGSFELEADDLDDDAGLGLKGVGAGLDDADEPDEPDAFDSLKGIDGLDDVGDELSGAKGGLFDVDDDLAGDAFGADLGEVPDLDDKTDLVDDDHIIADQKGSIVDALEDVFKDGFDEV